MNRGHRKPDTEDRTNPGARWRSLSGWGNSPRTMSEVVVPEDQANLLTLRPLDRGHIARGLGRSYGDAAQLLGGTVVDMTALTGAWLDTTNGVVTARAGTSLGAILDTVMTSGWFLPVSPGTRHVTVGGAIAADVHGKNHPRDGSFGQYVESLDLVTADGAMMTLKPGTDVFGATVGGMGLTGMICRATFRLTPIETAWMSVTSSKAHDLDGVMELLFESDSRARYSVAWIDLTRSGGGRGIVDTGEHATRTETGDKPDFETRRGGTLRLPTWIGGVVTERTVNAFNQVWFSRAPLHESDKLVHVDDFFYPLDRIADWNRLYGRKGFVQYQFVVPAGEETTLREVARILSRSPTPVALAVLKRMGPSLGGFISFPMPGWTLAVDMPLGDPALADTLDECDRKVANAGGRVYFAKDSRLRADLVGDMYPDLDRWRQVRAGLDPEGRLRSNLSERLELTG